MTQQTENERLKLLRYSTKLSQGDFADRVGLKQGSYSDVERGKASISPALLRALVEKFNADANWLLTGEGTMVRNINIDSISIVAEPTAQVYGKKSEIITVTLDTEGNAAIPVLNIQAAAGWPSHANDSTYLSDMPAITMPMQQYRKGDWALIQARGDSMETTISHGQWLMCKRLYEAHEIKDNNVYVVLLREGPVVKRVLNRIKKRGTLVLQSDNPAYTLVEVSMEEDVLQIWMVEMVWVFDLHNRNIDLMKDVTALKERVMLLEKGLKSTH